jgi:hypothetical protein
LYGFAELNAYLYEHGAFIALPLLLAIHRHLDMAEKKGEKAAALTAEVWKDTGIPPEEKSTRQTILEHLRRMPELVVLREKRTFAYRYCVTKGRVWRRMERANGKGREK